MAGGTVLSPARCSRVSQPGTPKAWIKELGCGRSCPSPASSPRGKRRVRDRWHVHGRLVTRSAPPRSGGRTGRLGEELACEPSRARAAVAPLDRCSGQRRTCVRWAAPASDPGRPGGDAVVDGAGRTLSPSACTRILIGGAAAAPGSAARRDRRADRRVRPAAVAVEHVLFQVNVRTAMSVGQASGCAREAAAAVRGCRAAERQAEGRRSWLGRGGEGVGAEDGRGRALRSCRPWCGCRDAVPCMCRPGVGALRDRVVRRWAVRRGVHVSGSLRATVLQRGPTVPASRGGGVGVPRGGRLA